MGFFIFVVAVVVLGFLVVVFCFCFVFLFFVFLLCRQLRSPHVETTLYKMYKIESKNTMPETRYEPETPSPHCTSAKCSTIVIRLT